MANSCLQGLLSTMINGPFSYFDEAFQNLASSYTKGEREF